MDGQPNAGLPGQPQTLKPWYRILRPPMLLTVPGEPVAGFLLASAAGGESKPLGVLLAASGAAIFFAAFDHLLNDLLDFEMDAASRPWRPLPSGEITVPQARMAAVVSALSGLNLALFAGRAVLYAGVGLCCLILARQAFLKRVPLAGACTAGLCRASGLLLGALSVDPALRQPGRLLSRDGALLCVSLACVALYTAAVSNLRAGGADRAPSDDAPADGNASRWLPFAVLLPCLAGLLLLVSFRQNGDAGVTAAKTAATSALAFLSAITLLRGWLLGGILYRSQPLEATVSGHFANLLLIQGALCSAAGTAGLFPAVTFVLLSVLFNRLR